MKNNIVWGFAILGIAAAYLLEALGVIHDFSIFKALLICFLGCGLIKGLYKMSITGTVYSLAFLYYFGASYVGLPKLSLWTILVFSTLLQIGLVMIFWKRIWRKYGNFNFMNINQKASSGYKSENSVMIATTFGETKRYIASEDFKKCDIACSFGETIVYFENAKIVGESATVNIACNFGEVVLYIPRNWNVDSSVSVVRGEFNDCNNSQVYDKTLKINGSVNFGEVTIYNI